MQRALPVFLIATVVFGQNQTASDPFLFGNVSSTLVTSKKTPTADAPVFGTPSYFRKIWNPPQPRIELNTPMRLQELVQGDKLELSLRSYVDAVLANNTDIAIQRYSVEPFRNQILRQYSIFDPFFFTSFNATRRQQPAQDVLAGALVPNTLTQPFQLRASQMLPTGTTYQIGFDTTKFVTNSANQTFNPAISSGMNIQIGQPLLRNRGAYVTRLPITIARGRLQAGISSIESTVLQLVTISENIYWDVISARENLRVQEQSLGLFEQSLKRSQRELELGAISQLDIYQPEQQYANAQISVAQARFQLEAVEDVLRRQMGADLDPKIRTLPIVLTEDLTPPVLPPLVREELVTKAIRQRPDVRSFRQSVEVDDLSIQSANNFLKPDLRLTATYSAAGLGGNYFPRSGTPLPPGTVIPPTGYLPGGLGDALSQVFAFNYPTYAIGFQLNLPLRDRAAAANYADAVVSKRLNLLRVRTQEQQVRQEVLNAITAIEQSKAAIDLSRIALDFAQKRVDAEQKKFDLGTTVLFFVLDAQTALARAQSTLVNSIVQHRRNLTNLSLATADLLTERGIVIQ